MKFEGLLWVVLTSVGDQNQRNEIFHEYNDAYI